MEAEIEHELSVGHRMTAAGVGSVLTSLFVTPLDVVKVRLQKQATTTKRSPQPGKANPRFSARLTPLDVVKTRMQAQTRRLVPGRCFMYHNGLMDHLCTYCVSPTTSAARCEWWARPPRPSPFTDGLSKIVRYEGVTSLWSGLTPTLVVAVPAVVGYFTLNDLLCAEGKRRWGDRFWVPMLAGSSARSAVVLLTNPVEMVRTKLQSERLSYKEIGKAIQDSTRAEGYGALWKGLRPTFARDVLFTAIYWGLLDRLRGELTRRRALDDHPFAISFASGAVSGMAAALVTHPLDVVKTQQQIALGEARRQEAASLRSLVAESGWASLYAGIGPRLLRIAPSCAIMIGTYDGLKALFAQGRL